MSDFTQDADDDLFAALSAGFGSATPPVLSELERASGIRVPRVALRKGASDVNAPIARVQPGGEDPCVSGRSNYELRGEIARGGMGVLFKGHDLDLGRDVALKVLRPDLAERPEIVQRFVEEAQIGGQLQHPGIVPVYELGLLADRRPFFAMKLVQGRTLSVLLRERDAAARRQLLDVFAAVCQTVAYAHSRGVVHRDLKPSNVLIGAFGEVQVIDWGLAKVLPSGGIADEERARLEREAPAVETVRTGASTSGAYSVAGSIMGTPAYMPPEQARGDNQRVDQRSDVFALGAILCEILTGAPPYTGEGEHTMLQAARTDLGDARARLDRCDADAELVALCRDCLEPEPASRPHSAEAVAERMQSYLASLEQRARRAEVGAAEARVRARSTMTLSIVAAALVLLGSAAWLWWREDRARRLRETDQAVASALADATLARGRKDWAAATAAMERARARLASSDTSAAVREQVASLGAAIDGEAQDAHARSELARSNAELLAELESVRQPEGDEIYPHDLSAFERRYQGAFAARGISLDDDEVGAQARIAARGIGVEVAAALDDWSELRRRAHDSEGAERLVRIAKALDPDPLRAELRDALAANDVDRLRTLSERGGDESLSSTTVCLLAQALMRGPDRARALELLRAARLRHPEDFHIAFDLARGLRQSEPPRAQEALGFYQAALALRPQNVEVWHELGMTLCPYLERPGEAANLFREVLARVPDDGHLHFHLGSALLHLRRNAEAEQSLRRSIELEPDYALAHEDLGIAIDLQGRTQESLACYRRALELDPMLADIHHNYGISLRKLGRTEEARKEFERTLELDPEYVRAYTELAYLQLMGGNYEDAVETCKRAIAIDPGYEQDHLELGDAYSFLGRRDEARAAYEEAVKLAPDFAPAHRTLALMYIDDDDATQQELDASVAHARKLVQLETSASDSDSIDVLGVALYAARDYEEARGELQRSADSGTVDAGRDMLIALCAWHLGEREQARNSLAAIDFDEIARDSPRMRLFIQEGREALARR